MLMFTLTVGTLLSWHCYRVWYCLASYILTRGRAEGRSVDGRKGSFGRRLTLKRWRLTLVRKQGFTVKAHKAVKFLDALVADSDADLWPAAAGCLEEVSKSARGRQGAGGDSQLATVRSCSSSVSAWWVSCQNSPALSAELKSLISATNDSL